MLLIYGEELALSESQRNSCYVEGTTLAQQLSVEGSFISCGPLHPTSMSREDHTSVTDGPYIETKEQLGGYFMIDVPNLDDAIKIAAKLPGGKWGGVEIRPVIEIGGLPKDQK